MDPFILLSFDAKTSDSTALREKIASKLVGWKSTTINAHVELFSEIGRPIRTMLRFDRRAMAIGDVHSSSTHRTPQACLDDTATMAHKTAAARFVETAWGRYGLFFFDLEGRLASVLRDPSGALGCVSWPVPGALVVTSLPGRVVRYLPPSSSGIDWVALNMQLADPTAFAGGSSIIGVKSLEPGGLRDFQAHSDHQIWTPAHWARQPILEPIKAKQQLLETIDGVMGKLADETPLAAEVSGGLDSSIVAASLRRANANVRGWLHVTSEGADADERRYAQAMTDCLGGSLRVTHLKDAPIDLDYVTRNQSDVLPSVSSFEGSADLALVAICKEIGARKLFTGMGGDGVLWAAPSPLILKDRTAREGPLSVFSNRSIDLARWLRRPILPEFWDAMRSQRAAVAPIFQTPAWIRMATSPPMQPWLADVDGLALGKQMQIRLFVAIRASLGATARRSGLDVIDPLLSQPVLEACLRMPLDVLVEGGRDRGLARAAFADRLPRVILERRSKGDTARRSAISLAEALGEIRELLLKGRLVDAGIIDRDTLDRTLTEEVLAGGVEFLSIYRALAIELWVRVWEARLSDARAGA